MILKVMNNKPQLNSSGHGNHLLYLAVEAIKVPNIDNLDIKTMYIYIIRDLLLFLQQNTSKKVNFLFNI